MNKTNTVSPGKLIVLEGADGSGKSTQAKNLYEYCQKKGIRSILTMEPGGTVLGKLVKDVLHGDMDLDPYASLGLLLAARAQHMKEIVRPAMERGDLIISDRGPLSTAIYQGIGKGIPFPVLEVLNRAAMGGVIPDATVIFTVPLKEALKRTMARDGEHSPYERSESYFRVVNAYNSFSHGRLALNDTFTGNACFSFSSENVSPADLCRQVVSRLTGLGLLQQSREEQTEFCRNG